MTPSVKLAEGKTKIIWSAPDALVNWAVVYIESKDDITAGDGARKDVIEGKSILATTTTCACFRLLNFRKIPTHYIKQLSPEMFSARKAKMIPIELVARRIATGSYIKRNPAVIEGQIFPELVLEMFYKDDSRHDPLMQWDDTLGGYSLYDPRKPVSGDSFLSSLYCEENSSLPNDESTRKKLLSLLSQTFLELETAWERLGVTLVDLKIECGWDAQTGALLVADVIDNDSWRIWPAGDKEQMKDKQVYRNLTARTPEALGAIKKNYAWVAEQVLKFDELSVTQGF